MPEKIKITKEELDNVYEVVESTETTETPEVDDNISFESYSEAFDEEVVYD